MRNIKDVVLQGGKYLRKNIKDVCYMGEKYLRNNKVFLHAGKYLRNIKDGFLHGEKCPPAKSLKC